jgi:hypothetical protein
MRTRLTYANVMTTIAIVLALGGATAFAATQLAKKSVGTKQLKANAVTAAKIKKNAVTGAKIKAGAVDGTKILDGSVTGSDINAASTGFSQTVARFRTASSVPFATNTPYPLGAATYTQNAGEDNLFVGSLDVNFPASCEQPREAIALLLLDAPDPAKPGPDAFAGIAFAKDKGAGATTRKLEFTGLPIGSPMSKFSATATTQHSFAIFLAKSACNAGGGVTASNAAIDVLGVK